MSEVQKSPLFSNAAYDKLKYIALVVLPAVAVLYAALAGVLSLPYALQVVGAITAVDTFLGVVLGLSTKQYNAIEPDYDGVMNVITTADKKTFELELKKDPEPLELQKSVTFKVNSERTE